MSLVQRILHAIRTLAEEESHQSDSRRNRNRHRPVEANNSRRQQAVSLIMTFRELFNPGGLNIILEDIEANRRPSKKGKQGKAFPSGDWESTPKVLPTSSQCLTFEGEPGLNRRHFSPSEPSPILPWHPESNRIVLGEEVLPLLHEERLISRPVILETPRDAASRRSGELGIFRRKKTRNITVPLEPDDENKTVATLREVLKWSPRKQSMAKFSVPMPREDEHKVVAVVQNAVNRVKEEQLQKKKRKLRLFKLTFC